MINLLTFDVEEWFQANYPSVRSEGESPRLRSSRFRVEGDARLEANLARILHLCEKSGATATFFVLGQTAERYPEIIPMIKKAGHEIASHGYAHVLVCAQSAASFRADLGRSLDLLRNLAGEKILGYRAPSWSVFQHLDWFFDALKEGGLVYDSSLFPARTFLYGDRSAPRFPHRIRGLLEIPASTLSWAGLRIPFASGFFFRVFPLAFIRHGIRTLNRKNHPVMVCLHPREIDILSPRPSGWSPRDRFIHCVGTRTAERKLERLLQEFQFCAIREYLSGR